MGMAGGSLEKLTARTPAPVAPAPFALPFVVLLSLAKRITLLEPGPVRA